jgi:O-antigen/teichoic acid export membrane protein
VTAWIVYGSKVAAAAIGFGTSIVIARVLGPDGRAEYFIASTVALGAFAICHLSIDQAIFWAIAERRASIARILKALLPLAVLLSAASVGLYWAAGWFGNFFAEVPHSTVLAGAVLAPILVGRLVVDTVLYASDRATIASASLVLTAAVQLVAIAVVASRGELTSAAVVLISAMSTLVGGLPNAVVVARLSSGFESVRALELRPLIHIGISSHLAVIAFWLALRADVLIVSRFVSKHDLGIYSLAVTLAELILLSSDALALAALGRHRTLERASSYVYSVEIGTSAARIAALQVGAVAIFGWPMILAAYGREWVEAYPVLLVLAPGMTAVAYMRPLGAAFIRAGRALERSLAMTVGAVVNVAGTFAVAPVFGIVGAGVVSTRAYTASALLLAWRVKASLLVPAWARTRTSPWMWRADSKPKSPADETSIPPT